MGKIDKIVFLSLVLDLFGQSVLAGFWFTVLLMWTEAFTIPLPLFPRIIEWYTAVSVRCATTPSALLTCTRKKVLILPAYYRGRCIPPLPFVHYFINLIITPGNGTWCFWVSPHMLNVFSIVHSSHRGLDGFSLLVCVSTRRIQLVLTPWPFKNAPVPHCSVDWYTF